VKSPRVDLAWAYIELLLTENSRLHQTIGKVDRLCGDILADCSREVYEANMVSLTNDLEDLGKFLEVHQEKIIKSTGTRGRERSGDLETP
jgi:hypothetical protein